MAHRKTDVEDEKSVEDNEVTENDEEKLQKFKEPDRPASASRAPLYIKHSYPEVLKPNSASEIIKSRGSSQVPDSSNNYGMIYHKPDSEGEMMMHELWVAKRRQEAFDWKTQQVIATYFPRQC